MSSFSALFAAARADLYLLQGSDLSEFGDRAFVFLALAYSSSASFFSCQLGHDAHIGLALVLCIFFVFVANLVRVLTMLSCKIVNAS